MANLAILLFLIVVGFSVGAEALKCYDEAGSEQTCPGKDDKCTQILNPETGDWVPSGCVSCDTMRRNPRIMMRDCAECDTDLCHEMPKAKKCQNSTNQPVECGRLTRCITIKRGEHAAYKGCGMCSPFMMQKDPGETCEDCNEDECNNVEAKLLKCYNTSNVVDQCTDLHDVCYTRDKYGSVVGKGCGSCQEWDKNCTECYKNECNEKHTVLHLECHEGLFMAGEHLFSSLVKCGPGIKCVVGRKGNNVTWGCDLCPPDLENCNNCDKDHCNDVKGNWPTCKAGAGNGAGEFYQHNECLEDLSGPKDMKLSATCFKQQVEGVTYKECGTCGPFVNPVTLPFKYMGKDQDKLNRNKCFECKTEGDPCNGGIVPHKAFWMLLLIGASVPWLVLPMMSTFIGF